MCQLKLQKRPARRILVGRRLSWVLKLWHFTESHIPPQYQKIKAFEHFLKKWQDFANHYIHFPPPPFCMPVDEIVFTLTSFKVPFPSGTSTKGTRDGVNSLFMTIFGTWTFSTWRLHVVEEKQIFPTGMRRDTP